MDPWVVMRHRLNEAQWFKRLRDSRALYIGKRLYQRYMDDDVGMLAAAATYYLILALVPFMIFLFNIILFVAASQIDTVLRYMQYLPGDVPATLAPVVTDIIEQRSTTVLSIGLLLALWSSSKGIDTLIRATDIAFQTGKNVQSYIRVKTKSILFTLLIVGTMLASLGITVFGNLIVKTFMGVLGLTKEFLFFWR
ncbi:MAG: YhjD/YihY/BrkB family envelope integrity protein, partial [Negativicoccus succinicivorans]|nr:YhjD/YihY/BrkB family envelope integrity protein [Negativicoccus succinicivorans]